MMAVDVDMKLFVTRAKGGDPQAWDRLLQRYQMPLYAYVFEMVREQQASLDIVQETFINACRHIGSLREDDKFASWLFGIAHQKCAQHWRHQARENRLLDPWSEPADEMAGGEQDPGELLIRREQEERFMAMLNRLPPPQRSVVLLHFVEDFPLEEIAEITGIPMGTVKSRLHYAKKMLRQWIEQES